MAAELVAIGRETARLTDAIAMGAGELQPLVEGLQARRARRAELLARRVQGQPGEPNRQTLERRIRARLDDWRGLLVCSVQDGREVLRQLLSGPLRFTPQNGAYRFEGVAAIGRLLGSTDAPTNLASPTGLDPFRVNGSVVIGVA